MPWGEWMQRTYLEREINRKPTYHAFALLVHGQGIGAELDVIVQDGFEVAG